MSKELRSFRQLVQEVSKQFGVQEEIYVYQTKLKLTQASELPEKTMESIIAGRLRKPAMLHLKYTAFHKDFSTLDIERGCVTLEPSTFIQIFAPQKRLGEIALPEEVTDGQVAHAAIATPPHRRRKVSRAQRRRS